MWAIFADVHGNLEACNAVWEDLRAQAPTRIFSLGDMVGYGPDPLEVLEFLEHNQVAMLQGNHEWALRGHGRAAWFNPMALEALQRTRELLGPEAIDRLQALPYAMVVEECRFVHGFPPHSCLEYAFKAWEVEFAMQFTRLPERIHFVGHTHMLGLYEWRDGRVLRHCLEEGRRRLDPAAKWLVNVGSVGQPREGDKRAKYVLWDPAARILDVRAVAYDARATARKIIDRGLPRAYAARLL